MKNNNLEYQYGIALTEAPEYDESFVTVAETTQPETISADVWSLMSDLQSAG